jgi:hypothetical protein
LELLLFFFFAFSLIGMGHWMVTHHSFFFGGKTEMRQADLTATHSSLSEFS